MDEALESIFICVVLPVAIVLIIYLAHINNDNKRAKVLIKAIEANNNIDADKLAAAMQRPQKTNREIFNRRLLRGCIFSLVGLVMVISGIVYWIIEKNFDADGVTVPLTLGGILIAVGASFLIVCYVNRKQDRGLQND